MSTTPLLQQYFAIKEQHPRVLLFFQVGDFYELFFEDAVQASAYLGIALTKRGTHQGKPVPLCGVPIHSVDHYLVKLVRGGFRVALCEQLEPARPGRVVERGVTRVLTPGTLTDLKMLSDKKASYCATLFPVGESCGALFLELLTGHIFATAFPVDDVMVLETELGRFSPDEIVLPESRQGLALETSLRKKGFVTTLCPVELPDELFDAWLKKFSIAARDAVGQSGSLNAALLLLFRYLSRNQAQALEQCTQLFIYSPEDYLLLDAATQRNLEIIKNTADGSSSHTLFGLIDRAMTSMGSRMLKKWLLRPLVDRALIEQRLDAVEHGVSNFAFRESLAVLLKELGDLERTVGRIILRRAQLHDYRVLTRSLRVVPQIVSLVAGSEAPGIFQRVSEGIADFSELQRLLEIAINHESESDFIIASGYHDELDRLRSLTKDGAQALAAFERQEQLRTGINSLKVTYSRVQGYALEVTKANRELVPTDYERLQTLANRERFTTAALKELESDIVRAQGECTALEQELYRQLCVQVESYGAQLKKSAQLLAQCDAILGLALVAYDERYTRPEFSEGQDMIVVEGRHPVVAHGLKHEFIPNDTTLTDQERTWIITGPNMGGKSTYLRQVALMAIMAQMGSFVPARRASMPIFDRIFTRIGAADNVAAGKSTFLVEMEETALICNRATSRSLLILDEVGRGTSTHDGVAIAQAVLEYLHTTVQARVLFATHYHELTILASHYSGIVDYHAASKKTVDGIILLHKIVRGVSEGSFGIEVAKGVNLPVAVVARAEKILESIKK